MDERNEHTCVKVCLGSDSIDQRSSTSLPFAIPLIHLSYHELVFCVCRIF